VRFIQVKLTKMSYIGTLLKVLFIMDSGLFRVWFRYVYTGFWFIQGLVKTSLYKILIYSGFGLDRFIQDSDLFRVRFRQISL